MQDIIKNPDGVYVSSGGNNNIIFAKDGDIVILAGNKAGHIKGKRLHHMVLQGQGGTVVRLFMVEELVTQGCQ